MSLNPLWRPAEDETTILNERTWLAGTILTSVAYGVVFTLFVLTFKQLIKTTTKYNYTQRLPFIIYIIAMLIFGTVFVGSVAKMTELSFIDYRLFPGGPAAFEMEEFAASSSGKISNVSIVISSWLTTVMSTYRYLVIFRNTHRFPLWVVMLIPVLAYMAFFSLSVVWIIQILAPASSPWNLLHSRFNFSTPYLWIWVALDFSTTMAICARLLFYRRRTSRVLGPNHGTQYTSVAAILVESSSLSSVAALLFKVPFTLNSPIKNVFSELLGEVSIIASLLIIYRVAYGAAWVSETSKTLFSTKEPASQNFKGVRVRVETSGPHRDDEKPLQKFGV